MMARESASFVVTHAASALGKIDLKLYPNPAARTVNLESDADMDLGMYNSRGVLIKTVSVHTGQQYINLEDLVPGLYFLRKNDGQQVWRLVVTSE